MFSLALALSPAAWLPTAQVGVAARRGATRARVRAAAAGNDELVAQLRAAKPKDIAEILAKNINAIDQRLFLSFADAADAADNDDERDEIAQLSSTVASTLEKLLAKAAEAADADAESVQELLQLAADSQGEFEVPIPLERASAVREQVQAKLGGLDDGFVGTIEAYMKKADGDGQQGLTELLRELLQIYATERLLSMLEGANPVAEEVVSLLRATLQSPPAEWEAVLRTQFTGDGETATPEMVLAALQDKMGEVVLGMPSGSRVQGVLAEMLNELISKTRVIDAEMA